MSRQDETYSGAHVGHNPAHGSAPHLSSSRESQQGAVASAADAALPHNHVSAASTHSSNPHGGGDYLRTISSLGSSADAQASSGGVALATDERVLAVRTRVMNCLRVAADDLQLLERELRPDSRNSTPTRGAPAALSHPHSSVCCDAVSVESRRLRSIIDAMSASAEEACTASLPDISGTSVASPKPVPAPRDSHHRRDEARPWKVRTHGMRSRPRAMPSSSPTPFSAACQVLHVERNPAFLAGAPPSRQVVPQPEKPATQSTQSLADQVPSPRAANVPTLRSLTRHITSPRPLKPR
jgi:hypothetical protein